VAYVRENRLMDGTRAP